MSQLIIEFLTHGSATSKDIQRAVGLKQAAVSKNLSALGDRVVMIKGGRAPKYALTTNVFGSGDSLPLFAVDAYGNNAAIARVRPLAHGGSPSRDAVRFAG
ncbi:MAG: hypothetical protein HOL17_13545 [Gammaproteobacteria bacterium]|jgi:hypothetical protein|nr:hypothetical protein [Gammaproteobacteria bacterium]MBT5467055.1 hypothetical protein [Candidatus Neomarinimicrobiota bacterium]